MLGALRRARGGREEIERLAGEQAALGRVATMVAGGAAPGAVFAAVAEEVGTGLPEAGFTMVGRYDPGGWSGTGGRVLVGRRPARVDDPGVGGDAVTVAAGQIGLRSAAGAPISVEGRLWGVMIAPSARETALPSCTDRRLTASRARIMCLGQWRGTAGERRGQPRDLLGERGLPAPWADALEPADLGDHPRPSAAERKSAS